MIDALGEVVLYMQVEVDVVSALLEAENETCPWQEEGEVSLHALISNRTHTHTGKHQHKNSAMARVDQ